MPTHPSAVVQAMHAGAIRLALYNNAALETPYNVTVAEITNAISELRNSVGGVTTSAPARPSSILCSIAPPHTLHPTPQQTAALTCAACACWPAKTLCIAADPALHAA